MIPLAASTVESAGQADDICRAILQSKTTGAIVLSIPGTSYRLTFAPRGTITSTVGKRIRGRIRGRAMRMHAAAAGGKFIEPIYGHPRIVQGTVVRADVRANALLVDISVPAWLELSEGQSVADFAPGTMVNMYVESGMSFEPAE